MPKNKIQKDTEEKTKKLEKQVIELENNWKRSLADYQNLQKRFLQEKEELTEFSNLILIKDLLPVVDNLKLASLHSEDVGIKMVYEQFIATLKANNVEIIEVLGKEFDPTIMEASEVEEPEGEGKQVVSTVIKDGFKFKEKVIRAALVTIKSK